MDVSFKTIDGFCIVGVLSIKYQELVVKRMMISFFWI